MIYLVDGSHLLHRIRYTPLGNLKTSDGRPSGLVHGFLKSLISIRKKNPQAKFIVAWDKSSSKFRTELYKEYKANRYSDLSDEDVRKRQEYNEGRLLVIEILGLLKIPSISIHGIEADDIIAYLCSLEYPDRKVVLSDDKDLLQLVSSSTDVYRAVADKYYDVKRLIEEFKLEPESYQFHYAMIKAMCGDKSDNIEGIRGIGPKYASKIAGMILRKEELPDKGKFQKFKENRDVFIRNLALVDLHEALKRNKEELSNSIKKAIESLDYLSDRRYDFMAVANKFRDLELKKCLMELSYLENCGVVEVLPS